MGAKRFYRNILLSLAVALVFGFLLSVNYPHSVTQQLKKERFWTKKTHGIGTYDLLLLGDSRIYRGLSPESFEDKLGLSAINLGYSSTGLAKNYLDFCERYMKDESIILIGVTPNSLSKKSRSNQQLNQYLQLDELEAKKQIYLYPFLEKFEPYSPKQILKNQLKIEEETNYQQEYRDNGWVKSYYIKPKPKKALRSYEISLSKDEISPLSIAELCDKISSWKNQNHQVFCFRPPASMDMDSLENKLLNFNEEAIIKSLEKAGATWIVTNRATYDSYDGSHLSYWSAEELSRALADSIAAKTPA